MIFLIVGKPRSGKSQFAVKKIFDQIELNKKYLAKLENGEELDTSKNEVIRQVYSDIEGLNIEGVLPAPDDWRDVPDDSVIFYDEVHYRKEYEDLTGKPSQNPMIKDLTTHGHRNIDIYLITQASSRIERSIRGLVDCIYYAKRPQQKPPFCTIYEFDKFYNEPAYAAEKGKEHDKYIFHFKDKYQNAYKSASAHTSVKFKLQKKFYVAIAAIVVMAALAAKLMFSGGFIDIAKQGLNAGKEEEAKPITALDTKIKNCMDQFGWTEEQCKMSYDPKTEQERNKQLEQSTGNNMQTVVMQYNANKPFDTVYEPSLQPTDFPRFSGCMKQNGKYIAYTQQGTILKDVSQADCQRVVEQGDRPFDYFKQPQQVQNNAQLSNTPSYTQPSEPDIQQAAKFEQAQIEGLI